MSDVTILPATPERFADVEHAMTGGGDGAGCWCQWWTLASSRWKSTSREERRELLRQEIESAPPPGLIAYVDGVAAGWVRVGPRLSQPRIGRSRTLKASPTPQDDPSAWAITCFVVRREYRRQGLNELLIQAAVDHARDHGARVVEGYPIDLSITRVSSNDLFHGALSTFEAAGFTEVARPGASRPIVALTLA
ncbi:GNAT family N-acetyltransferase [Microbacterium sp.]|uniref:GNAT family N-acetyltransferase n=1 Tax=Microbacterium sp. TaxID=51671 RepID=UPI0039E25EBA